MNTVTHLDACIRLYVVCSIRWVAEFFFVFFSFVFFHFDCWNKILPVTESLIGWWKQKIPFQIWRIVKVLVYTSTNQQRWFFVEFRFIQNPCLMPNWVAIIKMLRFFLGFFFFCSLLKFFEGLRIKCCVKMWKLFEIIRFRKFWWQSISSSPQPQIYLLQSFYNFQMHTDGNRFALNFYKI